MIIAIYWNGLFAGAPRSDHSSYFNQVGKYSDFLDIVANTPYWQRIGDDLLFRPLLYLQLNVSHYLFGYNFFYWQVTSLVIHILVVIGLFNLFARGRLGDTLFPFIISALFGCAFISSEIVFWNHITGYITFSLFGLYTVIFLLKFISTNDVRRGYIALLYGILAEFFYELGFVMNSIIFLVLSYNYVLTKNRIFLKFSVLFLAASIMYVVLNIANLALVRGIAQFTAIEQVSGDRSLARDIPIAVWYALQQIAFWLGGWALPAGYEIAAENRANFRGFHFSGIAFLTNFTFVIGLVCLFIISIGSGDFYHLIRYKKIWLSALCVLAFLFVYSFVIAFGRTVPRGWDYFNVNMYYSYIACLSAAVCFAVFFVEPDNKPSKTSMLIQSHDESHAQIYLMYFILFSLIAINSYNTYRFSVKLSSNPDYATEFNCFDRSKIPKMFCMTITASTVLEEELGPSKLTAAIDPGWHALPPITYPQMLEIDFRRHRLVKTVSFRPQSGHPDRAPKGVTIETSDDKSEWKQIYSNELTCSQDSERWNTLVLPDKIRTRYIRIQIISNCGNPGSLTLKGLKFGS